MTPPTALDSDILGAGEAPCDQDDIFGPSRSFPPRNDRPRPSMISAKLRAKEERKKVIQICTEKLEKIKDPDRNLRRSVCINNTYFKLQDEVRMEKQMKHAPNARLRPPSSEQKQRLLDKALESIDRELSAIGANMPSLEHELLPQPPSPSPASLSMDVSYSDRVSSDAYSIGTCRSRKRSFGDMEDCDVHEVLSQFYMPPTPRLISAIDDDAILDDVPSPILDRLSEPRTPTRNDSVDSVSDESSRLKPDFESGFEEILELDLNQNKSYFQSMNGSPEPQNKRMRCDSATSPRRDRFPQRRPSKSEFEIILDALRLDDGKDLCDREELMFLCGKDKAYGMGGMGMEGCGQAALLRAEQQAPPFPCLPAELET